MQSKIRGSHHRERVELVKKKKDTPSHPLLSSDSSVPMKKNLEKKNNLKKTKKEKGDRHFITKRDKTLLQNVAGALNKIHWFHYKMLQLLLHPAVFNKL